MLGHFDRFIEANSCPGLILIPSNKPLGDITETLLFIWLNWRDEGLRNQLRWLPHP